jgi:hypothetical protein
MGGEPTFVDTTANDEVAPVTGFYVLGDIRRHAR